MQLRIFVCNNDKISIVIEVNIQILKIVLRSNIIPAINIT